MTNKEFNKVVRNRINKINNLLCTKGEEYSSSKNDRLINFTIAADYQMCTRKQALLGMLSKHLASLSQMINTDKPCSNEVWSEKIGDSINYLILLEAMVYEENDRV